MAAPFLSSPQTGLYDLTRAEETNLDLAFSQMPSFISPIKPDDALLQHIRNPTGAPRH